MKFFLVALVLTASLAISFADPEEESAFQEFRKTHGKAYGNAKEEAKRKLAFLKAHRRIKELNSKGNSWVAGHNHMSDWTEEEMAAIRGFKKGPAVADRSYPAAPAAPAFPDERALPTSVDLRTSTCLQPIKDQGQCGNCYAFSLIAALEFMACKKNSSTPVSLSEQQITDCAPSSSYYCYGCNGGDYAWAGKYLMSIAGSLQSTKYPYKSGSTGTANTCTTPSPTTAVAKPLSSSYINVDSTGNLYPNETNIMQYLQTGPVPAAINSSAPSFSSYSGGIYADPACNVGDIDHAVTIVGYGVDTTTNTKYWIVRNSWSTLWGEKGYFRVKRGVNQCFIETYAAFVKV